MKLNLSTLSLILVLFILSGCEKDFLQRDTGVTLPEEGVFNDPVLAAQFADNSYNFLVDDYFRIDGSNACMAQASDEAIHNTADNRTILNLNRGLFFEHGESGGQLNEINNMYTRMYQGIRNTTKMLEQLDQVPWKADQSPQRIKGEQYFLRAYFYFELIKRFGGVVIIDKVYKVDEDIDLPRNSYEDCVAYILKDLDEAEKLLPTDYDAANNGRATIGAAKALRARTLLYAASPLNNPTNDAAKWQQAADAAKAVMAMNAYSLQATYADILQVPTSPEYIFYKIRGPRSFVDAGFLRKNILSNGSGGSATFSPTQNHVDLYEMKNGLLISDPTSGYDPQKPYVNRDPRFYANILYNDAPWQGRTIAVWEDKSKPGEVKYGVDYNPSIQFSTKTRYYCRKLWPEVYRVGSSQTALVNFIFFRYAEILLNYAEVQNEAAGPDASVYDAVNQIRKRAGMPNLPAGLTKDQMRERIRNERAIELAFEDIRWYDILRWKAGVQLVAQPLYGMNVQRQANGSFTYTKEALAAPFQRVFQEHMHRYPIPRAEIQKSRGKLIQNPGW